MAVRKYVTRNGVTLPADVAYRIAVMRMSGYSNASIAEKLDLTEAQVVGILNVNRD